ncbi:MAG: ABC transporter substrate-binding protein [Candidatus Thorarchaeota archaeon]
MRRSRSALSLCCIFLFIFLQTPLVVSTDIQDDIRHGPFVDKVVYKVINDYESRILALQEGVIDIDSGFIEVSNISKLLADPNIEVIELPRNGYGDIIINCARYPLNISGFRRAFAYAFNKTKVMYNILDGHASLHDSLVPSVNRWCAEDLFDFHYYDAEPEIGNTILDELEFTLNGVTGFRDAPNGNPFSVTILYEWRFGDIHREIANVAVEALQSLNVSADTESRSFWFPPNPPENDDFDMITYSVAGDYDDIDWLVSGFGSEYIDIPDNNPSNFGNDTYDSWIDQLRNGKMYSEIYEASAEMQKILHYNVPRLVVYQNTVMQSYRNDKFIGHVEDLERHISGPWTLRSIINIDNTFGGTVGVSLSQEPYSFNIYTTNSRFSNMIFENLYSSLYSHDPNMNPIPDLVESKLVEVQSNHSGVTIFPLNHMRFTFDIIQNATWTDGEPLTAEDVVFTLNYLNWSSAYGNPAAAGLSNLVAAYAPTPYRAVIEFNTESYWHFYNIAYEYIIPKHIFTNIDYSGWNTWNPVFDSKEPHVTSGPFFLTDFDAGEFYELTVNPDYHYYPDLQCDPPPCPLPPHTTTSPPSLILESLLFMIPTASFSILVAYGIAIRKGWISNKTN